MPLRHLSELGLTGAWPGLIVYAGCALVLVPLFLTGQLRLQAPLGSLALG